MSSPSYIPSFYFYKFAQGISEPYTALKAYSSGAIDDRGNLQRGESSIDPLEYLIIKLKKIFEELPQGMTKAKLNNYLSTLQLFGEEAESLGITKPEYEGLMEGHLIMAGYPNISFKQLTEDMGVGGMAAPASSPGYNTGAVSGNDPVMAPMQRRKQPVKTGFDACEMFDVCPEELQQFKDASDWKYVPEGPTKKYLRRYQLRNPNGTIALRSINPDTGEADIHWVSLKSKKLKEEKSSDGTMISENANSAWEEIVRRGAEYQINPPRHLRSKSGKKKRGARSQLLGAMLIGMHNLRTNPDMADEIVKDTIEAYGKDVSHTGMDIQIIDPKTGKFTAGDVKGENTTTFAPLNQTVLSKIPGLSSRLQQMMGEYARRGKPYSDTQKEKVRAQSRQLSAQYQKDLVDPFENYFTQSGMQFGVVPSQSGRGSYNFPGLLTVVPNRNIRNYARSTNLAVSPRFAEEELQFRIRGGDINTKQTSEQIAKGAYVLTAPSAMRDIERRLPGATMRKLMGQIGPEVRRASQS